MSTVFEIYPGTPEIPTFGELLQATNKYFKLRLRDNGIVSDAEISATLRYRNNDKEIPFNLDSQLSWDEDKYAWFTVDGIIGGTDSYFNPIDDLTQALWNDYVQDDNLTDHRKEVYHNLSLGHYWRFRRSIGQPGTVSLIYGLLAGSLAELTQGHVFSDDTAWVWNLLPSTGSKFLNRYLVPGSTNDSEAEECTSDCWEWIPGELAK